MKLLAGSSHRKLAENISKYLKIPLINCTLDKFHNGEIKIEIHENIRNQNIYIIQTGGSTNNLSVNDIIMETMIIIDACKRSMANSITLIMPLFPYSRQDKKDDSRCPISAKVVATMFETAGMDRMVTIDLHSPQIQGFFNVPVDNIYSLPLVKNLFKDFTNKGDYIIVSPDAGGMKRAITFGKALNLPVYAMYKERNYKVKGVISKMQLMGNKEDIKGKIALILDDISDTCNTLILCAEKLKEYGIRDSKAIITHGVLSQIGLDRLAKSDFLSHVYVSETLPTINNSKLSYFNIDILLGQVIECLQSGSSISSLFS